MEPYEHRKSRPLHRIRYGRSHFVQHRDGIKHGHRRRSSRHSVKVQASPTEAIRKSRRFLRGRWPAEIGKQVALGALLAVGLAFLICVVWGAVTLLTARHDLSGAQGEATSLAQDRNQLFTSAGRKHAGKQIASMQHGATAAANLVDNSIPLHVLGWIPFVGQQVNGVTSLVDDFDTTAQQAGTLLGSVNTLVKYSHGTTISLPSLDILAANVKTAVRALRPLHRGTGLLIGPIASARSSFDTEIAKITALLGTGEQLLRYAGPFLGEDGPRRYLLAGENNAEMRDQGAVLSWAILSAKNGTYTMTSPESVGTLSLQHRASVILPPGTKAAFGALQPARVWQSVNATGGFPLSGTLMAAMYQRRTHRSVDGVIGVDVVALRHVLEATGPVKVKDIKTIVNADTVERLLLHGLYEKYPLGYEQNTRHDEIAATATAAVDKMKTHPVDLAYLVDQLAKSATGRHLLVWSRFPVLERAVTKFGGSGSLTAKGPSSLHLSIQSAVAAKLDYFVHTYVTYRVSVDANGSATIESKVVVVNSASPHHLSPSYVYGPDRINSFKRGQYVARLDQWFPRGAIVPGGLSESGLTLARAEVNLLPGQKKTYLLTAVVPNAVHGGVYTLHFVPQSSLWPQGTKVLFTAPAWSVTGPKRAVWFARGPTTLSWQLSR